MMSDPAVTKGMAVVKELFKVRSDPADILARGCTPTSIPEKSKAHSARCSLSRAIYFFVESMLVCPITWATVFTDVPDVTILFPAALRREWKPRPSHASREIPARLQ